MFNKTVIKYFDNRMVCPLPHACCHSHRRLHLRLRQYYIYNSIQQQRKKWEWGNFIIENRRELLFLLYRVRTIFPPVPVVKLLPLPEWDIMSLRPLLVEWSYCKPWHRKLLYCNQCLLPCVSTLLYFLHCYRVFLPLQNCIYIWKRAHSVIRWMCICENAITKYIIVWIYQRESATVLQRHTTFCHNIRVYRYAHIFDVNLL